MTFSSNLKFHHCLFGGALLMLAGCDTPLDFDLRSLGNGFNTTQAAQQASSDRPQADNRGIISYPGYQVAIARQGDKIGDIAGRVGIPAGELSRYNGIDPAVVLRANEVIALPRRVAEPSAATGASASQIDITTLAGNAINRVGTTTPPPTKATAPKTEDEPIRHKVERGETAFSISRLYNVSVRALAKWNGLGNDLSVRADQYLLIPTAAEAPPKTGNTSEPGAGSATPEPPSSATALPGNVVEVDKPVSPDLGNQNSDAAQMVMPVEGKIIRGYTKKKNDGIDIAAAAGTPVRAADGGVVAAITRDTEQVPIVVLKHAGNLLTVYAGVENLTIKKGDRVKRGQKIATVRAGDPSFMHFEVRKGLDSVDPMSFLN